MKQSHILKAATIALLSLGSVGVVGGGFLLTQAFNGKKEIGVDIDKSNYQEIRNKNWSNQALIKHFPAIIPSFAKDARVIYYPGSPEYGRIFQLRMKLPEEQINQALFKYRDIAKYKYQGGDANYHMNQENGVHTTFLYSSDLEAESFPSTYEILVLNANNRGTSDFSWNHGDSYGVAINNTTSEIIYWAEEW
ncbi:MAG: hypothetical protein MJK14_04335 [Rivularia sp. ALOHA_DT_140]|nr:hypothetical protein [Rivularia sp. ALOHA_DT_140]